MFKRIVRKLKSIIIFFIEILLIPIIVLMCVLFRFLPKRVDVGIGPLPMINNVYWSKALKRQGYTVETFAIDPYFITDEFDYIIDKKQHPVMRRMPALFFLWSASRYSIVYIYFNGGPLIGTQVLKKLEPYLYKLANVKTVVSPYGADVQIFERTRNRVTVCNLCKDYPGYFRNNHVHIIKQVDRWTRNANIVIAAMDSIDYLWFWNRTIPCHFAIDTDSICPDGYSNERIGNTVKILHAPNHMSIKGTEFIESAIERLKSEGYDIEYVRIQNLPNKEVIKKIKEVDIVIDQLVMGWYAMFAMEAMACAKPCICYLRDDLVDTFVRIGCLKNEIPLISATTDSIYEVLKNLLEHKEELKEIGVKSREYVVNHHSLDAIGSFFAEINSTLGIVK